MAEGDENADPSAVRPGLRIPRGASFVIPAGALRISIGAQGVPEAAITDAAAKVQMWPDWLEAAFARIDEARLARKELQQASLRKDDTAESAALAHEFRAAIQAISAGVFAVDAFYSVVAELVPIPEAVRMARHANGTPRATWVADCFGRAARMPNASRQLMTKMLHQAYRLRNEAVHPPHRVEPYAVHPGLNQAVPRVYANYTLENARGCVAWACESIMWVTDRPRTRIAGLAEVVSSASTILHGIVDPHLAYNTDALQKGGPR